MNEKTVTVIPAKPSDFSASLPGAIKRRRVAAYARVSTDKDEQLNSYEAQVDYYRRYIRSNPEWEYVDVYADVDASYGLIPKNLNNKFLQLSIDFS